MEFILWGVFLKKITAVFLSAVLLIFIAGCGESRVPQRAENISFSADFETGGVNYSILTELPGGNKVNITVNSPQEISGMRFVLGENGAEMEFLGLKNTLNYSGEFFGVLGQLYSAFLGYYNNPAQKQGDNYVIAGDNYKFTLTNMGLPISLELKNLPLTLQFKNVSVNN